MKNCSNCKHNQGPDETGACVMPDAPSCYPPELALWEPIEDETPDLKTRGHILKKAHEIINGERQDLYGNPEDSFELIASYWSSYLTSRQKAKGGSGLSIYPHEVAEMMMLLKIARMAGKKLEVDNYCDLAGYAGLAADMVEK